MKITYYGHSALLLNIKGKNIIVDPFITGNPNVTDFDIKSLEVDYIMITHAHYDHIMDVDAIAEHTGATIISNHEIAVHFQAKGFTCHEMNFGGSWDFDFGRVKMVHATHSSTFTDGKSGGNPAGYVIQADDKTLYIAGDTALTMDMQLIPMFFNLDLAIFPIGGNFTMDIGEAMVASDFVKCNKIMGMHYNTMEIISIDNESAIQQFKDKGKELILLDFGESITI